MPPISNAPTLGDLLTESDLNAELPHILHAVPSVEVDGKYLHWDEVSRRPPPEGLTRRQLWLGLKFRRTNQSRDLPLRSTSGMPFGYGLTDGALEQLHWIDQHAGGEILVSEGVTDPGQRKRYLVNSLMEESITSSQLEGASVTRRVAKEMLRTNRRPRDRGERMILNNYRAMSRLAEFAERPLDTQMVFELHRILTDGTLDNPDAAGRMQLPHEERVRVVDSDDRVVHIPPPAEELAERMAAMVQFANGDTPHAFVHPVVRAILIHLWLAYDHPFEDGNGRTARALFYWAMLRQKYWMFEYLSISRLLVRAPAQYGRAFLLTETDEFDATYFTLYQLKVIRRAVNELMSYVREQMHVTRRTIALLRRTSLNHRQVALLTHAIRHPDYEYTIASHAQSHGVTRQSGRTDLIGLEEGGFLLRRRVGRKFFFYAVADLQGRLNAADSG
ncbi:MAG: Fic family protein [Chloroflexi bacterium]|nr:Fic family protein [Chloroflexota bacterium]